MVSLELLKETNKKLNICDDLSVDKNKNIIFVYCPPKVGSTTLVSSIRMSAFNKFTVLHIHDELMLKVLCNIDNVKVIDIIKYNRDLGKNVYVFDIYRSPIEQKISQYFEKLSTFTQRSVVNPKQYIKSIALYKLFPLHAPCECALLFTSLI